ncbi:MULTISPECIES: glycoside hydrolase family 88 protein [unclassified Corallococcus]|uniref:glycoside hydrolase family 88 protein n=1 Tax=unclassified Corallococcus TaxID=2685029 RepID=UPI001A8DC8EB|nr:MULTISPECIES: glycoside hydrolase family 88 protein [unclassified Corallococcus]MBN9681836.1 glycoside hydrolase family 88 protein [Corallococcus sp. NCSPR001]WAS86594.1 glycoside hydrolase family 88 protein [Corallococcus sp. NCRR]
MGLPKPGVKLWWMLALLVAPVANAFTDADAVRVFTFARAQLADTILEMPSVNRSPKASTSSGTWTTVANTDRVAWTQGFFPGSMWYMFQVANEPYWRDRADLWTRPLEVQKTNTETHDLGFKMYNSYGNAYRLTGNPYYRDVLLTSAASLATRYNSTVGIIDCCDWNPAWNIPLVTDTMMDIELLLWGAQNGGPAIWRTMAVNHALRTLQDAVRTNGSSFHYVDYNNNGTIRSRGTFQGYSSTSTWARGQAWLIYGFTMVYRYTQDARFLTAARRVTDYYLANLPADRVPNWDFNAPSQSKDSSAAAVVASALLELSTLETDATRRTTYRNAALAMLDSLASPAYLAQGTNSPGILLHGVGNYPAGQEINVSLIYGDYYFIEALLRFNPRPNYPWYSKLDLPRSQHLLGTTNTGTRIVEFDLTPLADNLGGGVVGWTDSSTEVTAFNRLNMALRMSEDGIFQVRNGAGYSWIRRVPYVRNQTYHFRMNVDLLAKRYSVWVTPPGAAEVQLVDRVAFRSDGPPIDDLGRVAVISTVTDSDFRVNNHRVYSPTASVAAALEKRAPLPEALLKQLDAPAPVTTGPAVPSER